MRHFNNKNEIFAKPQWIDANSFDRWQHNRGCQHNNGDTIKDTAQYNEEDRQDGNQRVVTQHQARYSTRWSGWQPCVPMSLIGECSYFILKRGLIIFNRARQYLALVSVLDRPVQDRIVELEVISLSDHQTFNSPDGA